MTVMKIDLKECQNENYSTRMKVKQLGAQKEEIRNKWERREKDFNRLKKKASMQKEGYKAMVIKVQTGNAKVEQLENALSRIQDENAKLAIRGAHKYGELTPRFKNFSDVFDELGIDKPKLHNTKVVPSDDYIRSLIDHARHQRNRLRSEIAPPQAHQFLAPKKFSQIGSGDRKKSAMAAFYSTPQYRKSTTIAPGTTIPKIQFTPANNNMEKIEEFDAKEDKQHKNFEETKSFSSDSCSSYGLL